MSSLHTLAHRNAAGVLPYVAAGDALLLIEEACYLLAEQELLTTLPEHIALYVLEEDLIARGLDNMALPKNATRIDYQRFVELCCHKDKVINWFDK